jgi:nitrogen fixation/metabolism regulation signal transduction histidine kinase
MNPWMWILWAFVALIALTVAVGIAVVAAYVVRGIAQGIKVAQDVDGGQIPKMHGRDLN